jgi:HEAT repeat protein
MRSRFIIIVFLLTVCCFIFVILLLWPKNIDKNSVESLLLQLKDERELSRIEAAMHFGELGANAKASVPFLIKSLETDTFPVRIELARSFLNIDPTNKDVQVILKRMIKDKTCDRGAVALVVGRYGAAATESIPDIVDLLEDQDKNVRQDAAQALGSFGPLALAAVPSLVKRLDDPDQLVKIQAAQSLGRIRPESEIVVTQLAKALRQKGREFRIAVIQALGKLGFRAKSAVSTLVLLFDDPDAEIRTYAAQAICGIRSNESIAVPALISALKKETSSNVKYYLILSLGCFETQRAMICPVLGVFAAGDLNEEVRRIAVRTMSELACSVEATQLNIDVFRTCLKDRARDIRLMTVQALIERGQFNRENIPDIQVLFDDENEFVRREAEKGAGCDACGTP